MYTECMNKVYCLKTLTHVLTFSIISPFHYRCEAGCAPAVEPLLLRVKTSEDADQLLAEINKLKE